MKGENSIWSMTSLQVGSRLGERPDSCRIPLLAQGTRTWVCSQDSECFVFCVLVSCLFTQKNKLFLDFCYNKNVMTNKCHCLLICQSWLPRPYQSCTDLHPGFYFPFNLGLFVCLFIVKRQMNILLDCQVFNILFCSYQGFFQKKRISCSLKEWKTVESISLIQMDIKLYDPPTIFALHTRLNIPGDYLNDISHFKTGHAAKKYVKK